MIKIIDKNIEMNEGDFGIKVPITITNILETDDIKFIIKNLDNTEVLTKKLMYNAETKKFEFELTKEDSNKLVKNNYLYSIVQLRNETLKNTIVSNLSYNVI